MTDKVQRVKDIAAAAILADNDGKLESALHLYRNTMQLMREVSNEHDNKSVRLYMLQRCEMYESRCAVLTTALQHLFRLQDLPELIRDGQEKERSKELQEAVKLYKNAEEVITCALPYVPKKNATGLQDHAKYCMTKAVQLTVLLADTSQCEHDDATPTQEVQVEVTSEAPEAPLQEVELPQSPQGGAVSTENLGPIERLEEYLQQQEQEEQQQKKTASSKEEDSSDSDDHAELQYLRRIVEVQDQIEKEQAAEVQRLRQLVQTQRGTIHRLARAGVEPPSSASRASAATAIRDAAKSADISMQTHTQERERSPSPSMFLPLPAVLLWHYIIE